MVFLLGGFRSGNSPVIHLSLGLLDISKTIEEIVTK